MTVMSFPEDFISHFAEKTGGVVIVGMGMRKREWEPRETAEMSWL